MTRCGCTSMGFAKGCEEGRRLYLAMKVAGIRAYKDLAEPNDHVALSAWNRHLYGVTNNVAIDTEIAKRLIQEVDTMIQLLKSKGTTSFTETAEVGMLRVHVTRLIGDLQFYKVLPESYHVESGVVAWDASQGGDE